MRAQCRAAPKEERLSTLRILSKLVLLLSTRAVVERCKVRGSTLGILVLWVVSRMTLWVTCRLTWLFCVLRNRVPVVWDPIVLAVAWVSIGCFRLS